MNIKLETKLNEPSDSFLKLPFARFLPCDEEGIIRLRIAIWERCVVDPEFRRDIDRMCALDVVFFVVVFGWMHETRETQEKIGEFIPILGQDQLDILSWWQEYGGKIDITNAKTRGIGLSYLACYYVMWLWLYCPHRIDIGMLTRDEAALDKRDKPGSLMGKLDLIFAKLPPWVQYDENGEKVLARSASNQNHRFFHKRLMNNVTGYVPTSDKLRSDRLYVLIADEAAALELKDQDWLATAYGTVDSVIWISTHKGKSCMFYRMTQNTKSNLIRIETWWWNNARCRRGMYRIEAGRVVLIDEDYKHEPGYFDNPLIWEQETWVRGRPRSIWLDRPFFRPEIQAIRVLEEYYGLTALEDRRLLSETVFRVLRQTCRPPLAKGFLDDFGDWVDDAEGPIWLWVNPEQRSGTHFIGVDPGLSELGGAYKVAAAFDARTGEQVAVMRYSGIDPTVFPQKVAELGDWLSGAKRGRTQIAFESTGVGVIFHDGMKRLKYPALCSEPGKERPGYGNADHGAAWLLELGRGIITGEVKIRDERVPVELDAFEWDDNEDLQYSLKDGHGDTAIATSLMWWGGRERRRLYIKKARMPEHFQDPDSREEPLRGRRRGVRLFSDRW